MTDREYVIPGLTFERLAADEEALKLFQGLLRAIKSGNWDVTEAVEVDDDGLLSMKLRMKVEDE